MSVIFLRAPRLFRLMRVFKLGRYSAAMQTMARAVRSKAGTSIL